MTADRPIEFDRALLVLGLIGLALVALALRDRSQYKRFATLTESKDRIRRFQRWLIGAFLAFGAGGVLALWSVGRLANLLHMPPEFAPAKAAVGGRSGDDVFGITFGVVFVIGILVMTWRRAMRGQTLRLRGMKGVLPLLPRNPSERVWLALLSVNAGVTEEIFFRLLVPLLLYTATGSLIGALVGGCVIFGLIHAYQGIVGIVVTTVLGGVFTVIYVATGSLILTMVVHVVIDLNTLVILPWLRSRAGLKAANAA